MMKKICLCILGLLIPGMLCVPVAAETGAPDNWSFYIANNIKGISDVELDGHGYPDRFMKVNVSDSRDQVTVKFVVSPGVDTTLTITKSSVNKLRKEHPDLEPVLYAWGLVDTYDVDAGGLSLDYFHITICEHLKTRGSVHKGISETIGNPNLGYAPDVHYIGDKPGDHGYWSFYIKDDIAAFNEVKLNGHSDGTFPVFLKVNVSDVLDEVEVRFVVYGGPDTPLTITKDHIDEIRAAYPGWEPALFAWGDIDTYDVDAGAIRYDKALDSKRKSLDPNSGMTFTTISCEHLKERGLIHHTIGGKSSVYFIIPDLRTVES